MKLSILISTIDDGINNISSILLQERGDVEYIVSHQYTDLIYCDIPDALIRSDVQVSQISGKGLSRSRNNAIKHATGEIGIIADDDVRYEPEYFDTVIQQYKNNQFDVICFKIKTPDGQPVYKSYPKECCRIIDFMDYTPSSIEITFRLNEIKSHEIQFDERFGLGAKFTGGEESIFINDCLYEKLKVYFIPEYIVQHDFERTNSKISTYDPLRLEKGAAVRCRINGISEIIKIILRPILNIKKLVRNNVNPLRLFYHQIKSVLYILLTDKKYNKKQSSFHIRFQKKHP
jgi:glycosyltransferase involved in cell wall biosynthesis